MSKPCYKCHPEDFKIEPGVTLPVCERHYDEAAGIAPKEEEWVENLAEITSLADSDPKEFGRIISFIKGGFIPKERVEEMLVDIRGQLKMTQDGMPYKLALEGYQNALLDVLSLLSEDK